LFLLGGGSGGIIDDINDTGRVFPLEAALPEAESSLVSLVSDQRDIATILAARIGTDFSITLLMMLLRNCALTIVLLAELPGQVICMEPEQSRRKTNSPG